MTPLVRERPAGPTRRFDARTGALARPAGWCLAIVLTMIAGTGDADAATRVPYGGEILAYVFGGNLDLGPDAQDTSAEAALQAGIFEGLYRIDAGGEVQPVLASGPPEGTGRRVRIPLRRGVLLHDGRVLAPEHVRAAMRGWRGEAGYLLSILEGGPDGIAIAKDAIELDLVAPYPSLARLLAVRHARISVAPLRPSTTPVGTGPFRLGAATGRSWVLEAFLGHHVGRPFIDRLRVEARASRFAASTLDREDRDAVWFGRPDGGDRAEDEPRTEADRPTVVLLGVGRRLMAGGPGLVERIDAALQRERLVERFLGPDAEVARRLVSSRTRGSSGTLTTRPAVETSLFVPRDDRAGHRFFERVQLDLLRAQIRVRIERMPPSSTIDPLSHLDGLRVMTVVPASPRTGEADDDWHTLLSMAWAVGAAELVTPERWTRFAAASPSERAALVDRLEADLCGWGLVPIAHRSAGIDVPASLVSTAGGALLDLADLHRREAPR